MKGRLTTALLIALVVVAVSSFAAMATGTLSGTVIKNTATLNYKDVNNNLKQEVSAFVETTVSTVRGVDVDPATYSTLAGNEQKVLFYPFTITNTGNADDTIALSVAGLPGTVWTYEIFADADGNSVPDSLTPVSTTGLLTQTSAGPDPFYKVVVKVTAPSEANFNGSDIGTLTATSSDNTTNDTGIMNVAVASAIVDIMKTSSNPNPRSLEPFTYTITVTNTGTAPAYFVVMKDTLVAQLVFEAVSDTTYAGHDGSVTGGVVTWNIGPLAAGATKTLDITVHVAEGTAEGLPITNTANLEYKDANGTTYTDSYTSTPGTAWVTSVDIASTYTSPSNVDPGDYIAIPFTVTNTGNRDDSFDLTYSDGTWLLQNLDGTTSTTPITWAFYTTWNDTLGSIPGVIEDGELSGPVPNTGILAMDASVTLYAATMVPGTAHKDATSTVIITATSTSDTWAPLTTDTLTVTNNVIAPVLTLTKSVLVNGAVSATAIPTDILTYTLIITNTGDGTAKTIVLEDVLPVEVTYEAGTLAVSSTNPVGIVNEPVYTSGTVTVTFDEIPAGAIITITFNAKVN